MYQNTFQYIYHILPYLTWYDIIEIGMLSLVTYYFLTWLTRDTTPLLEYFCCTTALIGILAVFPLPTLTYLAWHLLPIYTTLLLIFHQHTLQKHYITWQTQGRLDQDIPDWQTLLMQLTLRAWDKKISLLWIIEQHDALDPYFVGGNIRASLTPHLMELITNSSHTTLHHIWITKDGIIRAHNPHVVIQHDHLSLSADIAVLSPLLQKMHVLATHHDCIIMYSNTADRTNSIIHRAVTHQHLSSQHCLNMLQKLTQPRNTKEYSVWPSYRPSSDQQSHESSGRSS